MKKKNALLAISVVSLLCACQQNGTSVLSSSNQPSSADLVSSKYTNSLHLKLDDDSVVPFYGADPDIIRGNDGYFYLYTSQNYAYIPGRGRMFDRCPIYRSEDMVNWTYCSSVFTDQDVDLNSFCFNNAGIWAPSISCFNGQYYLYYSIGYPWTEVNNHEAYDGIGLAVSDTPYGPWTHYGELFTSADCGVQVSIDPFAAQTDDGTIYLFWGSFNGIWAVEMSIDGIEVKDKANIKNNKIVVVEKGTLGYQDLDNGFEATYIFKKDGKFYFTGSRHGFGGGLNSLYDVYAGSSDSLLGPYKDSKGNDIFGHGDLVVDGDFDDPDGLRGVGHNSIIEDDAGDYWIVYHCYDPKCPVADERTICIDKLIFEDDGSFHTAGSVASHTEVDGPRIYK